MSTSRFQNQILQRLDSRDFSALEPLLQRVPLHLKQVVIAPDQPIERVYFVESGLFSVIAATDGSEAIECGMIGREGISHQVLEPGDTTPLRTLVQAEGSAFAVGSDDYIAWIAERPKALRLMMRYQQYFAIQLAYTALSHGSFTIEERLARWLLMSFDRSDEDKVAYVHEFLAMMLAVRRSGVTNAVHVLEGKHAIRATRGHIELRDREILEILAAGSYGKPEAEYKRLLGVRDGGNTPSRSF